MLAEATVLPQMEQMFAGTSFLSDLLAELFGLLFYCPVLCWVSRSQKLYLRYLSFLLPLLGIFGAAVWKSQDDDNHIDDSTREESKVKLQRHGEEVVLRLSGRDVEMVMERMGLGGGGCGDVLGAEDLNCLFEEEPSLEEVKEAFRVFDHNGDGFIDAEELQRVLSILGFKEGSSADDCRRMISAYDENKDGRIDFNEFVKFMECSFC